MNNEKEFREYLDKDRNASLATMNAYIADIKEFEIYINKKGLDLLSCSTDVIRSFLIDLKDMGRSGSTINRKMVSLRKYYEFLRMSGQIEQNPTLKLKVPKVAERGLEYLTVEQMLSVLEQPDDTVLGMRDKALLELMYACGLKASEVSELNFQDIDLRIGFVSCRGDKTKIRIIPMGHPARDAILKYMKEPRMSLLGERKDTGALFLNYAGHRISRQGIWKIIKYYGQKAGVSDNLNPQIIRNSFAAHMIMNGADLKSLQALLGNEDLAVTKLFLTLSKSRVMDVYDKTHPRA